MGEGEDVLIIRDFGYTCCQETDYLVKCDSVVYKP